jgi:hypothetical protein
MEDCSINYLYNNTTLWGVEILKMTLSEGIEKSRLRITNILTI